MSPKEIAVNHLASLIQVISSSVINGKTEVVLTVKEGANVLHRHLCVVDSEGKVLLSTPLFMERKC